MDLISDIIRNNTNIELNNNTLTNIKKLNLCYKITKLSCDDFKRLINDESTIKIYEPLVKTLVCDCNYRDVTISILYAYYIIGYHKEIFIWYWSHYDKKLIQYSKELIDNIKRLYDFPNKTNQCIINNILNIIDFYYSLYSIWKIKNNIATLNKQFTILLDNVETYNVLYSYSDNIYSINSEILSDINNMNETNNYFSIHLFLTEYETFKKFHDKVWEFINELHKKDNHHILFIMIANIKYILLKNTKDISTLKNIYYTLDIDEFVELSKKFKLKDTYIINIIQKILLYSNINKHVTETNILYIIRTIFDKIT